MALEIVVAQKGSRWLWMLCRKGSAPLKSGYASTEEKARAAARKAQEQLRDE
jgi:hypothetical protein